MDKSLRKIVSEEVRRVFEDYDFSAEEREYRDRESLEPLEAEISAGLSFMQDMRGSSDKLTGQKSLNGTNIRVDHHIEEALKHIREAIQSYLETMSPDAKSEMTDRMGEINI